MDRWIEAKGYSKSRGNNTTTIANVSHTYDDTGVPRSQCVANRDEESYLKNTFLTWIHLIKVLWLKGASKSSFGDQEQAYTCNSSWILPSFSIEWLITHVKCCFCFKCFHRY
ncbi:hypothetical protein LRAMOSA06062 [Lichtheimia ramosa]|uniref:Uncharacterized protein n=1 Tax=Lichtheimia ramosa TaxID=688394 RepID=A0A077X341_9FUNG|nr:hypothetical protein LRAMOSA06062 [Lichtheimia ramosa]